MDNTMIKVWRFKDAPVELQALSNNGGDEDWLVALPPEDWEDDDSSRIPGWIYTTAFDAGCDPQMASPADYNWLGWTIMIGSHA